MLIIGKILIYLDYISFIINNGQRRCELKILNFGSMNIDKTYSLEHIVRPGETVNSMKYEEFIGGKGLNQSVALAHAGAKVWHAGLVGSLDGGPLVNRLNDSGVNTSLIESRDNYSGHALIQIDQNGMNSIIVEGGTNTMIDEIYIDKVLEHAHNNEIYMKVYIDDCFYVTEKNELNEWSAKNHDMEYKVIKNFNSEIFEDINLLIMFYDHEIDEEHLEEFAHLNVEVTTSMPKSIELIPKGVSKASGLRQLKKHLDIKQEEILAIGNSFNDLSMLQFAGRGIAMKNSDPILLNSFDNISQFTNNEEGVYKILKEYI